MFCIKCGKQIPEGVKFCPYCGNAMSVAPAETPAPPVEETVTYTAPAEAPVAVAEPETVGVIPDLIPREEIPAPSKKTKINGKKLAMFGGIGAVIIAAGVLAFSWFGGNGDANTYKKEVESYLNCIANKEESADKFITDMYFGGDFGYFYSGKDSAEIHEIYARAVFDYEKEQADMGYGYGEFEYDTWKDYVKESSIDYIYDDMEYIYGEDWKFTYKIGETEKASESEIEELQEFWEETTVGYYESLDSDLEDVDVVSDSDKKKLKNFINKIENLEVTEAYCIDVEVSIEGSEDSCDETVEFVVAKIGNEWVIMEGFSMYDLLWMAS